MAVAVAIEPVAEVLPPSFCSSLTWSSSLASSSSTPMFALLQWWVVVLGAIWVVMEIIFYVVFHRYLCVQANLRTVPPPYRPPYDTDKRSLLQRIVHRILLDRGYDTTGIDADDDREEVRVTILAEFLLAWFRKEEEEQSEGGVDGHQDELRQQGGEQEPSVGAEQQQPPELSSTSTPTVKEDQSITVSSLPDPPSRLPSAAYSSSSSSSSTTSDDETSSDTASVEGDSSSSSSSGDHQPQSGTVVAPLPRATSSLHKNPTSTTAAASSSTTTTSSTSTSSAKKPIVRRFEQRDANGVVRTRGWIVPGMTTLQVRRFFAWGFFGADEDEFGPDDPRKHQLQACVDYLHHELHVYGDDDHPPVYFARRMTLEDVQPWHRPLLVYGIVYLLRCVVADWILRAAGFRPVTSSTGLRGWVRASTTTTTMTTPLVFFHGIAPAAILLYLPLVLLGFRAPNCLLVENPNISCTLSFAVLSEDDTVHGVHELVERYFGAGTPVVLAGHSFGSCPITWILNHNRDHQNNHQNSNNNNSTSDQPIVVRDVLLLDPVTILLSESDVMINFLYAHEKDGGMDKIRMVASSELFTEYYLRRRFAWYNAELWLDDHGGRSSNSSVTGGGGSDNHHPMTTTTKIFVGLAGDDEIVNSAKVHRHIVRQQQQQPPPRDNDHHRCHPLHHVDVHLWDKVGHGSVVIDANKWPMLRQRLAQSNVVEEEDSGSRRRFD